MMKSVKSNLHHFVSVADDGQRGLPVGFVEAALK